MHPWLNLQCPDCSIGLSVEANFLRCPMCQRRFDSKNGIVYLLPRLIDSHDLKEREKNGWRQLAPGEPSDQWRAHLLDLPYVKEPPGRFQYWREAARQFDLAAEFLKPLEGKRGLDLGGSIGWAAYRFSLQGCQMVLADFNDSQMSGLGAARAYLDSAVQFDRICVDAECLPFAADQFDFVFSCAFLHHLSQPHLAVKHVARVLKPGGFLLAANESFRPFWMSRRRALARCQLALRHLDHGINEQVFPQRAYKRWFAAAGLSCRIVNPRWDLVRPGRIEWGAMLKDSSYRPEILTNRAGNAGFVGLAARGFLRLGLWRPLATPSIFPRIRSILLSGTQKHRILIGQKRPAVG